MRQRAIGAALAGLAALAAVAVQSVPAGSVEVDVRLTADTLLVMGGSLNPQGLTPRMQQELGGDPWHPQPSPSPLTPAGVFGEGYIDTENNPDSPFAGWDYSVVEWPAQISVPLFGMVSYGESQRQGLAALQAATNSALATLGAGEQVTAFGYSSSANVMVRQMRALQQAGAPATDRLSYILLGNPNRPNGGVLQRFAGLYIPLLDVDFDGSTPLDTPYQTLDISWEYDAAADFPTYPLNLLAVANSVIFGLILHGNYFRADIDGARAFPDVTVGNITYITLEPPHLPLLLPLYDLGVPAPLLDLVEPALTAIVDRGYDRTSGPGTPQTATLIPAAERPTETRAGTLGPAPQHPALSTRSASRPARSSASPGPRQSTGEQTATKRIGAQRTPALTRVGRSPQPQARPASRHQAR